jgi:LmbE family N-acetylglucosaminyl deacetylase
MTNTLTWAARRHGAGPGFPEATRTVLAVWAHPDDEAYLAAGLLARAVDAGCRVVVATATRGEAGTADSEPSSALAAARERELADSLAAIGVTEHRWLRGAGTPLRDGALAAVSMAEGVGMVAPLIAELRPDLVVTFGPDGVTGHADHRAVSRWTTAAWRITGGRVELWYAALPPGFLARWGDLCSAHGVWMDEPPDPVDEAFVAHVERCSGGALDRKFAALAAHTSQTAGLIRAVGEQAYREWWSTEAFVSASAAAQEEVA